MDTTFESICGETKYLSHWVADLPKLPFYKLFFQFIAVTDRSLDLAAKTRECMNVCPNVGPDPGCLPETAKFGRDIASEFRKMGRSWVFRLIVGRRLERAAREWDSLAEDAEDMAAVIEARQDPTPPIPWEKVKEELGL